MTGQGSPRASRRNRFSAAWNRAVRAVIIARRVCKFIGGFFLRVFLLAAPSYADDGVRVRIAWGGGAERLWEGTIGSARARCPSRSPLGIEADEPGSMWLEAGTVDGPAADGPGLRRRRSAGRRPAGRQAAGAADGRPTIRSAAPQIEIPLADLSSELAQPAAGRPRQPPAGPPDAGRLAAGAAGVAPRMVFAPGETLAAWRSRRTCCRCRRDAKCRLKVQLADARGTAASCGRSTYELRAGHSEKRFRWTCRCRRTKASTT